MGLPINAVGHTAPWVKDNPQDSARRELQAALLADTTSAQSSQARRTRDVQAIVARRGLPNRSARESLDGESRSDRTGVGLSGIAEQLGMTVSQLITALEPEGMTIRQLFAERGIAPAPGSFTDLAG